MSAPALRPRQPVKRPNRAPLRRLAISRNCSEAPCALHCPHVDVPIRPPCAPSLPSRLLPPAFGRRPRAVRRLGRADPARCLALLV
ncbi:MAG: hypothetical protein B7X96_00165, partial [Novosphingobium sp. 17-62-8]